VEGAAHQGHHWSWRFQTASAGAISIHSLPLQRSARHCRSFRRVLHLEGDGDARSTRRVGLRARPESGPPSVFISPVRESVAVPGVFLHTSNT
jgi:hypothetical protein